MKSTLAPLALLLCLVAGCSGSPEPTVTPGPSASTAGPATSPSPGVSASEPTTSSSPTSSAKQVAIDEPFTYSDGVTIEIADVKLTELTEEGGLDGELAPGAPVQILSVKVTNGSATRIVARDSEAILTYGSKDKEADTVDDVGTEDLPRAIAAGATETGRYGFVAPEGQLGDVELEFYLDENHPAARFKGSIG